MSIKIKNIEALAELSRIEIQPKELEKIASELTSIIHYFEQISLISTEGIEPLVSPLEEVEIQYRKDEIKKEISTEEILLNSPEKRGNLFTVPPVV